MNTAKIFWSGRSQAVRLPKDFRFDTELVRIRRHGNTVILEPISETGNGLMCCVKNWIKISLLLQTNNQNSKNAKNLMSFLNDTIFT